MRGRESDLSDETDGRMHEHMMLPGSKAFISFSSTVCIRKVGFFCDHEMHETVRACDAADELD